MLPISISSVNLLIYEFVNILAVLLPNYIIPNPRPADKLTGETLLSQFRIQATAAGAIRRALERKREAQVICRNSPPATTAPG